MIFIFIASIIAKGIVCTRRVNRNTRAHSIAEFVTITKHIIVTGGSIRSKTILLFFIASVIAKGIVHARRVKRNARAHSIA
jgi:hypothetical protein